MNIIDLERLRHATVFRSPFNFMIATELLDPALTGMLRTDFPRIEQAGLFPVSELSYGPTFTTLLDELLGPEVEEVIEQSLDIKLTGCARLVTVRGWCRERDGRIHNDSRSKVASALLYLNPGWLPSGGKLRFLRTPLDLDDLVAEVPPELGTFVAFRRAENSWHGHTPYAGPRRYVMINWVDDPAVAERELARHRLSACLKRAATW
jgi:SM-20-related protein